MNRTSEDTDGDESFIKLGDYRSATPQTPGEQEEGLLGGHKHEPDHHDLRTYWRPSRLSWLAIAGALVAAVGIAAALLSILHRVAIDRVEAAFAIAQNDYVLGQDWDLDAAPRRREYDWTVRDQIHNPDGVYRPMILVNNQFPGPMVEANEGDTIVVRVHNRAVNATSIHWHGMYQNGTNHMDGTVGITQCPIPPGSTFTYEFAVVGQSGTYWWHAHQGVQSSDGVHGPLIIHSKDEARLRQSSYHTDRVLLLSDHYHDLSSALLWNYLKPDMENAEPVPQGALINGRSSVRNCDDFPQRKCDNTSTHVGLSTFDFAPAQSHRLRLINVGAFAEFQFQIDEHELGVVEVEGTDVEQRNYHRININPAQRYSVVFNATNQHSGSFWMRARMITHCFTDPPRTTDPEVKAVVAYGGSTKSPSSVDWSEALDLECRDMNITEIAPSKPVAAPAQEDAFFYVRSNFEIGDYRLSRGVFNSSSWRARASSPSLYRTVDGLKAANATFTNSQGPSVFVNDAAFEKSRELVVQTKNIRVVDILVSNFDDGNHPLHLHGYKYFVLAQGHGYPPRKSAEEDLTRDNLEPLYNSLDLSNPMRRDSASVEAFGWILLRLVTDNPGIWPLHCHISWHTEAGLLMQFLTRTDEMSDTTIPASHRGMCTAPGIDKGMGPDDADYHDLAK